MTLPNTPDPDKSLILLLVKFAGATGCPVRPIAVI